MPFFVIAKTVLKSLCRLPATRRYPFGTKRPDYPNTRGRINQVIAQCIFCGLCQLKCPAAAISVKKTDKQWSIDRLRCVTCGYCVEVCPKKCLAMENGYSRPVTNKSEDTYQNA